MKLEPTTPLIMLAACLLLFGFSTVAAAVDANSLTPDAGTDIEDLLDVTSASEDEVLPVYDQEYFERLKYYEDRINKALQRH